MAKEWRKIELMGGEFDVSNIGDVRHSKSKRCIIPHLVGGYESVNIPNKRKDRKRKKMYVHRLVALAFLPNPNNLETVNHIDEVKDNNDVRNLEWMTRDENITKSYECGRFNGSNNPLAILNEDKVTNIRKLFRRNEATIEQLASLYDVSKHTISDAIKRRTWKHI